MKDKVNLEDWTGVRQKKRRLATQTTSRENTDREVERAPEFRGPFPEAGSEMEGAPEIRSRQRQTQRERLQNTRAPSLEQQRR